jgi:uracil-DNA glycosylase family 4
MAFFKASEVTTVISKARAKGSPRALGCDGCGLWKTCRSPRMEPTGKGRKGILIIAEAPGRTEDVRNTQLVGKAGQTLRDTLAELDIDLDRDCWKTNAVNCRPPENRTPEDIEIECCRPRVLEAIERYKPSLIIPLGNVAVQSILEPRYLEDEEDDSERSAGGIGKWRGWHIPEHTYGAWVCPTYHPSYIMRMENLEAIWTIWKQDLKAALTLVDQPLPAWEDPTDGVEILWEPKQVINYLRSLPKRRDNVVSFDWETTGRKPQAEGHRIFTASVCQDPGHAVAFTMHDKEVQTAMRVMLADEGLRKSAHGLKFEQLWSIVALRQRVQSWDWCSMLAAHVLDNRQGVHGLKFQSYVNFGQADYSTQISKYLESKDRKNANSMNRIHQAPIDALLKYGGTDALVQHRLMLKQKEEMARRKLMPAYTLLHDGAIALVDAEVKGLRMDMDYCHRQLSHLDRRCKNLKATVMDSKLGKGLRARYGANYNLDSDDQLAKVIVEDLGVEIAKKTASGKPSVDADSLRSMNIPIVDDLLEYRKLDKIRGTYLGGWVRETVDGYMHPFFNLHTVVTYRSSSSNPNFQNVPKRDPESQKITRRAILPHPGHIMMELDYSGVEVRVAACYHEDPTMLTYIFDDSTDMHRDMAAECYKLKEKQVSKPLRQAAKNKFVFPQFYGDWWKACAKGLWADGIHEETADGIPLREHLASVGIRNQDTFAKHIEKVERHFWYERFPVYQQWKEDHLKAYSKRGYFKTLTGFQCGGLMMKNDAINYPVQGSAFHCLLWSFARITELARKEKWKSFPIGQIHDSIVMSIDPDELDMVVNACRRIMTKELVAEWKWIIVPLEIEVECTLVDEPWYNLKELVAKQCPCGSAFMRKGFDKVTKKKVFGCPKCGHNIME